MTAIRNFHTKHRANRYMIEKKGGKRMVSYEYYKVFYYACKYMNFTRAASFLGTSQSSVSHMMQSLEHQLECRLFTRSNRGIKLTPEGQRLYEYVEAGCEQFIKGENELLNGSNNEQGVIYLAATETALNCYLFTALNEFRNTYPNIRFKIENLSTYGAAEAVKSGVCDFAILTTPLKLSKGLSEKVLLYFQDVLVGGSQYEQLAKKGISLGALRDYPYISLCSETATRAFFDKFFEKNHVYLEPDIEIATTDMIIPMVRNNMGLGFAPKPMISDHIGDLYIIATNIKPPQRSINIVYNTAAPKSPAAKTFLSWLEENRV